VRHSRIRTGHVSRERALVLSGDEDLQIGKSLFELTHLWFFLTFLIGPRYLLIRVLIRLDESNLGRGLAVSDALGGGEQLGSGRYGDAQGLESNTCAFRYAIVLPGSCLLEELQLADPVSSLNVVPHRLRGFCSRIREQALETVVETTQLSHKAQEFVAIPNCPYCSTSERSVSLTISSDASEVVIRPFEDAAQDAVRLRYREARSSFRGDSGRLQTILFLEATRVLERVLDASEKAHYGSPNLRTTQTWVRQRSRCGFFAGHEALKADGIAPADQTDALNFEFDAEDLGFHAKLARGVDDFVDLDACFPEGGHADDEPSNVGHVGGTKLFLPFGRNCNCKSPSPRSRWGS
jgi:hypothetical protein